MTAFKGLLMKDFYISRNWFMACLIGDAVFLLIPFVVGTYVDVPLSFIPIVLIMVLGFHIFLLPAMLIQMLQLEGKTQLWLYNSQSSSKLLLSKLVVCFGYQLISQLFLTVIGLVIFMFLRDEIPFGTSFIFKGIVLLNTALLGIGLYLACWVMFYWCIYHSLGKFPMFKSFRWIILILIFFSYNAIQAMLGKIGLLREIANQWTVSPMLNQEFTYEQGSWTAEINPMEFPVFILILYILLAFSLFLFSSWLLDRKVEV